MEIDPMISIVVPIFNVEEYLYDCLNSIQKQIFHNFEVIMVNDGSTDQSKSIAKQFETDDNRFHYYEKENGGLSSARNHGLQYAIGKYICFVDSDDVLDSRYLDVLAARFTDETDIVIGDFAIFDKKNNVAYEHEYMLSDESIKDYAEKEKLIKWLLYGPYPVMSVWKNMYRSEFIKKENIHFTSERQIYAEDLLFNVEAYCKAKEIQITSSVVYFHLVVPGSLSQGYRYNYYEMNHNLRRAVKNVLNRYFDHSFVNEYLSRDISFIGSCYLQLSKCRFGQAQENIVRILKEPYIVDSYRRLNNESIEDSPFRYRLLYNIGRTKSAFLVCLAAKCMLLMNKPYRRLQKKSKYRENII